MMYLSPSLAIELELRLQMCPEREKNVRVDWLHASVSIYSGQRLLLPNNSTRPAITP